MIQVSIYVHQDNVPFIFGRLGLCYLTPLSIIFQPLYRGGQFYWWRKPEYPVMFSPTSRKSHFAISGIRYLLIQLPYEHNHDDHHLKTSLNENIYNNSLIWIYFLNMETSDESERNRPSCEKISNYSLIHYI